MGFKRNNSTASLTMRKFCILLLILIMLVLFAQQSLVDSRALRAEANTKSTNIPEAADGRDNMGVKVLASNQVFPMTSGPSRKGSGH
uniref:Uncharacterized protein n=1 Tax=Fagus sylvatica TaxID=28930 RepID=A0A2N9FEV5_FAGSY